MPRTVPKKDRFFGLFEKLRQPDITGEFNVDTQNFARWGTVALGGAFTSVNPYNVYSHDGAGTEMTRTTGIKMEASRANAIYGGTAVQMPSLRLMAIIKA